MRKRIIIPIATLLLCGGYALSQQSALEKLARAQQVIANQYVDPVDQDKLVEDAIKGMLDQLDPHSSYSNPEETKALNEPLQGSFSGIGIQFNLNEDTLYVIQTISGGPSERVGILAGDRIIAVNDTSIAGQKMKTSEITKRLRGPKGTEVDITVLRGRDTIDFTVTRDDIPIYSVDAAYMVNPTTGYIRLNKFAQDTPAEIRQALRTLKEQGMQDLILDLSDNGGGYLQAAVELLGEFLPTSTLAVYTEGTHQPRQNFKTSPFKTPLLSDGRLVVMLNQYSASASEITAGAIQDYDRGVIVGRRSFGKGLVQRPVVFDDGSMIRLTTAHYYTPAGRNIQKPYEKGDKGSYNKDIADRLEGGELMHEDSLKYNDSLRVKSLRNGRDIYGGGGIYPDRFVPLDTTEYTKYNRNLMAKGIFNKYVIQYIDKNRKSIKSAYKTDDDFARNFAVTPEMLSQLTEMGTKAGVEFNEEEYQKSKPLIETIVKALIGRDVFENGTYFKIYNSHDPVFREALRVIGSDDYPLLLEPGPVIIDKSSIRK